MPDSRNKKLQELAEIRRLLGIPAKRKRSLGSLGIITDIPGVQFALRRTRMLRIYHAMNQARRDAHPRIPVVLYRADGREWLAIVPLEDLVALAERLVMFAEVC